MKPALLFLPLLFLVSCNVAVERVTKSGDKVVLGRSFMSRSATETAYYESPEGEKMGYSSKTKDETVVPTQVVGTVGNVSTINAVSTGYDKIQ